jgi:hypothetical protein
MEGNSMKVKNEKAEGGEHSEHTPGPWDFNGRTCYGSTPEPTEQRGNGEPIPPLRTVVFAVTEKQIKPADRYLIAAAPEMLEALKKIKDLADENSHSVQDGYSTIAEWAGTFIAKATEQGA